MPTKPREINLTITLIPDNIVIDGVMYEINSIIKLILYNIVIVTSGRPTKPRDAIIDSCQIKIDSSFMI